MREYEHRRVERCVIAPPPFPLKVLPRSALRSKLVASHDFGADVAREVARAVVVEAVGPSRIGPIDPMRRRSRPREEIGRIRVTEGVLKILPLTGTVPIARHHEIVAHRNVAG